MKPRFRGPKFIAIWFFKFLKGESFKQEYVKPVRGAFGQIGWWYDDSELKNNE